MDDADDTSSVVGYRQPAGPATVAAPATTALLDRLSWPQTNVTGALVLAVTTFPGHALGSRHGASVAVRCSRRATYRGGMGPKVAGVMILLATVVGCSSGTPPPVGGSSAGGPSAPSPTSPTPPPTATATPATTPSPTPSPTPAGPVTSDGTPRDATLTIPALGIENLDVIAYQGWTDDAAGTEIQDRGAAASPYGEHGGAGPGGIGNYQVTAHRLSSTQAFLELPDLDDGDLVEVTAGPMLYVYEIVQTRETSFRSEESLAAQRAGVPGQPGVEPTEAMITLSTCATIEDHAAGNYWADEFGNPEHRIDKIGVLVQSAPAHQHVGP